MKCQCVVHIIIIAIYNYMAHLFNSVSTWCFCWAINICSLSTQIIFCLWPFQNNSTMDWRKREIGSSNWLIEARLGILIGLNIQKVWVASAKPEVDVSFLGANVAISSPCSEPCLMKGRRRLRKTNYLCSLLLIDEPQIFVYATIKSVHFAIFHHHHKTSRPSCPRPKNFKDRC